MADILRDAAKANPPAGDVKVDIADAGSGDVMATLVPSSASATAAAPAGGEPTPFQADVEKALRGHQIMGPRIVRFEWTTPGTGRVLVQNFPMAGMPDDVKAKFTGRLADYLRDAAKAHPPGGDIRAGHRRRRLGRRDGDSRPVVLGARSAQEASVPSLRRRLRRPPHPSRAIHRRLSLRVHPRRETKSRVDYVQPHFFLFSATWSAVGCSTFSCFFTAKSEALSTMA